MNAVIKDIHERAVQVSTRYKNCEAELVSILQEIDICRAYLHFEASSLYDYCVKILKLSESISYGLISIARKSREVPALKDAITSGALSVSKARKIVPVLTMANHEEWLTIATTQTSREIEKAVARENPQLLVKESVRYRTGDRIELTLGISESILKKLEKVMDIESRRNSKAASREQALSVALDVYLEKHDPVRKAERVKKRLAFPSRDEVLVPGTVEIENRVETRESANSREQPACGHTVEIKRRVVGQNGQARLKLNAALIHAIDLRDGRQCTYVSKSGERCAHRRWTDFHHIKPKSFGGPDTPENIITLCTNHHRMIHLLEFKGGLGLS